MNNAYVVGARAIWANVWDFRTQHSEHWLTPSPFDCAKYAFCEMGEALDARLREARIGDARNTDREVNEADEIADAIIMLVSILGPEWTFWDYPDALVVGQKGYTLENLCYGVGLLLVRAKGDSIGYQTVFGGNWELGAFIMAVDLVYYAQNTLGVALPQVVQSRLSRIFVKHVFPHLGEDHGA